MHDRSTCRDAKHPSIPETDSLGRHRTLAAIVLGLAMLTPAPAIADHRALQGDFGTAIHTDIGRPVRITLDSRWVNVKRGETVKFIVEQPDGTKKSFVWHFDTLGTPVFDLMRIAPAGILHGRSVTVYVDRVSDND